MDKNTLFTGDCLYILNGMNSESVDLIYLDPPFNSKRFYSAPVGSKAAGASFKDMWSWEDVDEAYLERMIDDYPYLVQFIESVEVLHSKAMMAYVTYMAQRVIELHRVLKPTGSLYLHCDPTASHYLKIVLDRVFGKSNYRNEIVWRRDIGGKGAKRISKQLPRNHDAILFYSKSEIYKYLQPYVSLNDKQKTAYRYVEEKTNRKYKAVQLGDYSDKSIKRMEAEGLIHTSATGKKYKKYYLDEAKSTVDAIWTDILGFGTRTTSKERMGYPTQKPLKLLERIIKASSNEGDTVLDPFCGCATTCVAAQQLNRKWIGIDVEAKSAELVVDRLSDDAGLFKDFVHLTKPPVRTDVKIESAGSKDVKERLFNAQDGCCNGCQKEMEIWHFEVDHKVPKSKGGQDTYGNYQLLCGNCNGVKGNRPMEYLRAKIVIREKHMKHRVTFGV